MDITEFESDKKRGQKGSEIFKKDFLEFLNIPFTDEQEAQRYQMQDIDYAVRIGNYEIKSTYKADNRLFIEEHTNAFKEYGNITDGWVYKSTADVFVFVNEKTRMMVFLPRKPFLAKWNEIKNNYQMLYNKISRKQNPDGTWREWRSSFRILPLKDIEGLYSKYRK